MTAPTATQSPQREALVARFTAWLDEALTEEAPPAGVAAELLAEPADAERSCDLFTLWSAMASLGQEVKLQGRTFHALEQAIAGLPAAVDGLRAANERVLVERRRADEERAFGSALELLLDLRERLRHGLRAASAHVERLASAPPPGRLARLLGVTPPPTAGDAERAFVRGYELALARLDDALRERGIEELACVGRVFDPHRMRAVELADAPEQAEGTVLEVLRGGYTQRGEVLRAAEVRVVRRTGAGS